MTEVSPKAEIQAYRKYQPLCYVGGAIAFILGIILTIWALVQHTSNSTQFNLQIIMLICAMAIVVIGVVMLLFGYYLGTKADMIEIDAEKGKESGASRSQPLQATSDDAASWFCQDCGKVNTSDAVFCGGCGHKKRLL